MCIKPLVSLHVCVRSTFQMHLIGFCIIPCVFELIFSTSTKVQHQTHALQRLIRQAASSENADSLESLVTA